MTHLGLEALVRGEGGEGLATMNCVCNVILFHQHPGPERLEEGREAGAAWRARVAGQRVQLACVQLHGGIYAQQPGSGSLLLRGNGGGGCGLELAPAEQACSPPSSCKAW